MTLDPHNPEKADEGVVTDITTSIPFPAAPRLGKRTSSEHSSESVGTSCEISEMTKLQRVSSCVGSGDNKVSLAGRYDRSESQSSSDDGYRSLEEPRTEEEKNRGNGVHGRKWDEGQVDGEKEMMDEFDRLISSPLSPEFNAVCENCSGFDSSTSHSGSNPTATTYQCSTDSAIDSSLPYSSPSDMCVSYSGTSIACPPVALFDLDNSHPSSVQSGSNTLGYTPPSHSGSNSQFTPVSHSGSISQFTSVSHSSSNSQFTPASSSIVTSTPVAIPSTVTTPTGCDEMSEEEELRKAMEESLKEQVCLLCSIN